MIRTSAVTSHAIAAALGVNPAVIPNGSAAAPGLALANSSTTGFYRAAANTLGISAGGSQVASFSPTLVTVGAFTTDMATGNMGLGRTDPGFPIDLNKTFTDTGLGALDPKYFFHMYGEAAVSALSTVGVHGGFYGHLDGATSVVAGKTVQEMYPHRGNLTWSPAGTLTTGASVLGQSRVLGAGTIATSYGGKFESALETGSTGAMTTGYGVRGDIRNDGSGVIGTAFGLRSHLANTGGGITTAYGSYVSLASSGTGIATYYSHYIDSSVTGATTSWGLYSPGTVKSFHAGNVAIGTVSSSATSKLLITDGSLFSASVLNMTDAAYAGTVERLLTSRAGNSAFSFLTGEANGTTQIRLRGDGAVIVNGIVTALSATAVGAGTVNQAFVKASSATNLGVYFGTGDPSFTAAQGSIYVKTDASTTTTRLWINTTGSTTWANFTASA